MNRRSFIGHSAATLAALGVPLGTARAAVGSADRKLIVVFVQGGWDPTRVFADGFDHTGVSMEADSERSNASGIDFIAHPDRPGVSAFMQAQADRMVVFNGVMVRSIAHEICTTIAMTGDTSGLLSDWPAIILFKLNFESPLTFPKGAMRRHLYQGGGEGIWGGWWGRMCTCTLDGLSQTV